MRLRDRFFLWKEGICSKHLVQKRCDYEGGRYCPECEIERDTRRWLRLNKLGVKRFE